MKKIKKLYNRTTRTILILIAALIFGFAGYKVTASHVEDQITTAPVLVAKGDIGPFQELTKDNTQVVQKVISEIPENAIKNFDELKVGDSFASSIGFMAGVPIQQNYITTAAQSKLGTSVGLTKGMHEIGVTTDLTMSAGGEIMPGTKVNVVGSYKDGRTNETITLSDAKLTNIKVVKVKNSEGLTIDPTSTASQVPAVIVLEVNEMQAQRIVDYQEKGKVYLMLTGTDQK
ncbi:Flp pilus assembly protein CpaB [Paenibacillus bovis]|uniref:Flp pilus assembly protein RcpC/CpaB domain-containing protein n=1 Tax=Paenibacillus bovis TaxID=1616788 RepID=A0A1X9T485_9BACL|nr:Flp pilus assembly protein CpaB [Paenibacillus bovis]ARR10743.1 hypothetical protein AR543_p0135 [Paenibacillus bovis]